MYRVSRLLAVSGLVDPFYFTQASRDRGHVVHAIAEAVFQQQTVTVGPAYEGYARALYDAAAVLALKPILVEHRLDDGETTGRPDVVGWLPVRVGRLFAGPAIVDVKSGDPSVAHGVQLAFYELLANNHPELRQSLPEYMRCLPWSRIGLYVRENGTYTLRNYDDYNDTQVAHAIQDLVRWKITHGLLAQGDIAWQDDDPTFPEEPDGDRRAGQSAEPGRPADPGVPPAGA